MSARLPLTKKALAPAVPDAATSLSQVCWPSLPISARDEKTDMVSIDEDRLR